MAQKKRDMNGKKSCRRRSTGRRSETRRKREKERDKEGKERGDARVEWASIEPRILPSTHTADGPALLNVFRGWLEILAPMAVKLHGKTLTNYWPSGH